MCKDCGCGSQGGNQRAVLTVPGMMCENCKATVESALLGLPGVMSAVVNLESKTVTVDFDAASTTIEAMKTAIDDTGFEVTEVATPTHHHHGMLHRITKIFK